MLSGLLAIRFISTGLMVCFSYPRTNYWDFSTLYTILNAVNFLKLHSLKDPNPQLCYSWEDGRAPLYSCWRSKLYDFPVIMIGPSSSVVICEGGWLWAPSRYQQSIGTHIHCIKQHGICLEPTHTVRPPQLWVISNMIQWRCHVICPLYRILGRKWYKRKPARAPRMCTF